MMRFLERSDGSYDCYGDRDGGRIGRIRPLTGRYIRLWMVDIAGMRERMCATLLDAQRIAGEQANAG